MLFSGSKKPRQKFLMSFFKWRLILLIKGQIFRKFWFLLEISSLYCTSSLLSADLMRWTDRRTNRAVIHPVLSHSALWLVHFFHIPWVLLPLPSSICVRAASFPTGNQYLSSYLLHFYVFPTMDIVAFQNFSKIRMK